MNATQTTQTTTTPDLSSGSLATYWTKAGEPATYEVYPTQHGMFAIFKTTERNFRQELMPHFESLRRACQAAHCETTNDIAYIDDEVYTLDFTR
jgi:hypothetical protein